MRLIPYKPPKDGALCASYPTFHPGRLGGTIVHPIHTQGG